MRDSNFINICKVYLAVDKDSPISRRVVKIATFPEIDKYSKLVANEALALQMLKNEDIQLNIPKIYNRYSQPSFIVEEFFEGKTLEKARCIHWYLLILLS